MSKTIDLMQPRFLLTNDYPGNTREVGSISTEIATANYFRKYTANFRELSWWEQREIEDMPDYVKSLLNSQYYKVVEKYSVSFKAVQECKGGVGIDYPWDNVVPATLTEYTNFINNKK